ncbi:MAG: DUF2193 family protein, partial [Methanomicrobiales archaeon]|nr:DUF2193 family protein [Methanomicrobiales archaeon]
MKEFYEKMINEAMGVQWADINVLKEKRGTKFKVTDGQPYVDAVNKMTVADNQSKAVIDLHVQSVNSHYESMKAITNYVRPEDDPFVEHYQTPVVLEVLREQDEKFNKSMETFIAQIGKMNAMIGLESARRYAGFYGPTCVVDFAMIPGSTSNVVNQVLKKTDIPEDHKKTLLAAKSWGMNTSYGVGEVFAQSVEGGATLAEGV